MKKKILICTLLVLGTISCNGKKDTYFTVTWKNYDGTTLKEESLLKDSIPSYTGEEPKKKETDQYVYKFNGWNPEVVAVTANATYTATYKEVERVDVIYKDGDGSELYKTFSNVEDIATSVPEFKGIVPVKEHQGDVYYYFDGWEEPKITNLKTYVYEPKFKTTTIDSDLDDDGIVDYLDPYPTKSETDVSLGFKYGEDLTSTTYEGAKYDINYYDMFASDNVKENVFSEKIASFGSVLNSDSYVCKYAQINNNENIKTRTDYKNLLERLGCDEVSDKSLNKSDYTKDKNDLAGVVIGHKKLHYGNGDRDFLYLVINQNYDQNEEWISNFDLGYKGQEYYSKEGTAHESYWLNNSQYHKGFYVSARRLFDKIIKPTLNKYSNPIVFLSGHSRGGALANIVGNIINNEYKSIAKPLKLFAYTYAAPNTYFGKEADQNNNNIFNIVNGDDIVPAFPFASWEEDGAHPMKHGITKTISANKYKDEFKKNAKKDYEYVIDAVKTFNEDFVTTRKGLYTLEDSGFSKKFNGGTAQTDAQTFIDGYKTKLLNMGVDSNDLNNYFKFNITQSGSSYVVTFDVCLASAFVIGKGVLIKGEIPEDAKTLIIDLFKKYESPFLKLIMNGLTSVESVLEPHYLPSYYLITTKIK